MIAALPRVLAAHPDAVYLVIGDGDDRPRLEALVAGHNVEEAVRFLGRIPDGELPDHYRLADVFVMPSTGEGFGIVFLEAAAYGLPVIGASGDGSADALADGVIGALVDPESERELVAAICVALDDRAAPDPAAVACFARGAFQAQVSALAAQLAGICTSQKDAT